MAFIEDIGVSLGMQRAGVEGISAEKKKTA